MSTNIAKAVFTFFLYSKKRGYPVVCKPDELQKNWSRF